MHVLRMCMVVGAIGLLAGSAAPALAASYRDTVAGESGLLGYWRFGETFGTTAHAERGTDATFWTSPTLGVAGVQQNDSNTAYDFSGQTVSLDDGNPYDVSSQYSLEVWIRQDPNATSNWQTIMARVATSQSCLYLAAYQDGKLDTGFYSGGVTNAMSFPGPPLGTNAYVVVTYDGSTLRGYVNGVLSRQLSYTGNVDDCDKELTIGSWWGGSPFYGTIDEPAIYNRALTAAEIQHHYDVGIDGTAPAAPTGLRAAGGDSEVTLEWNGNSETDLTGYDVYRTVNGTPIKVNSQPVTETSFVEQGLPNGQEAVYTVRALDGAGHASAPSAEARATPQASTRYRDAVAGDPAVQGYWRLGETSGTTATAVHGQDGTYTNGPTLGAPGLLAGDSDHAPSFDGVDDYVSVPDSDGLDATTGVTAEAWVRLAAASPGQARTIVAKRGAYTLGIDANGLWTGSVKSGGLVQAVTASSGPVVGQTYYAALAYDGAHVRIYVNGQELANAPETGTLDQSTEPLRIGTEDGTATWNGVIDDVAVYDAALSASTVAGHYGIGAAGTPPTTPTGLTAAPSNGQVALTWNPNPEPDVAGYTILRATTAGGPYARLTDTPVTATHYVDDGVTNTQRYYYVVRAVDDDGHSSPSSAEASGTPQPPWKYRNTVLARPGLRAFWRYGEAQGATTAKPEFGGINGTYMNGGKVSAAGLLASDSGESAVDVTNARYVSSADSPTLELPTGFTMEAWVKLASPPTTGTQTVFVKHNSYTISYYPDSAGNYMWDGAYWSGGVWHGVEVYDNAAPGSVRHIVVTYDGTLLKMYINGVLKRTDTEGGALDDTTGPFTVGSWQGNQVLSGVVDEVALYDQPLSAAQIAENYQLGSDGQPPAKPAGVTAQSHDGQVTLGWTPNTDSDLAGYEVWRSTTSGGPYERRSTAPLTANTFTDTDVTNDRDYFYVVRALDQAGNASADSDQVRGTPSAASVLLEPQTLHANGAELEWTKFDPTSQGGTFDSYEVHRSTSPNFTPSASTLIAVVRDAATTAYRDTTAAPGKTFTYKLLTNGTASGEQTVTLPADGQARKVLQPVPAAGEATYVREGTCANRGADSSLRVGSASGQRLRGLIAFDLGDVPTDASISGATLSLNMNTAPTAATTVSVYRAENDWREGTGRGECTGDGATWTETNGGSTWTASGGDFAGTASAQVTHGASDALGWDSFDVTGAVAMWAGEQAPNHGFVIKTDENPAASNVVGYWSDDAPDESLRPKLSVTYADGSHALAPTLAISSPTGPDKLRGTVSIEAAADDDGKVDHVDFLVDGTSIGTDSTAPYTQSWDTTTVANGTRTITVKATDDAGNVTTADRTVTVSNSAPPTTRMTLPSDRYDETVKSDSPAGYWRLGETSGTTAADASGQNRNGTYSGSFTLGQPGLFGASDGAVLLRNGTTDGTVTIPGFSGLLGTQVSAEASISYTSLTSNNTFNYLVTRNWQSTGGWALAVQRDSSGTQKAYWAIRNSKSTFAITAPLSTAAGPPPNLNHLAGSYDGTTLKLYVNGVLAASSTQSGVALNTTANVLLGQNLTNDITLDEAAVYSTALAAARVKAHYDVAKGNRQTIAGTVPLQADAQDDLGVEKVEFYLGDNLVGTDTTAPYTASLATTGSSPVYDGDYDLTSKAYDTSDQVTTSAPIHVHVGNADGTKYVATFSSSPIPAAMSYDDSVGAQQDPEPIDVTVTNKGNATWTGLTTALRATWIDKLGNRTSAGSDVLLTTDVPVNGQATKRVTVTAPALPPEADEQDYTLEIDLVDNPNTTPVTFASKGDKPLTAGVSVARKARIEPGLEDYYHYDTEGLGAGMRHLVNVASGNSIVRWTPFVAPGRGLDTVLDLTYNALDDRKKGSPVGNNWSLAISSLTRFGDPLDIHPNNADTIAGRSNKWVDVVDADGTTHRFTGVTSGSTTTWTKPDGFDFHLTDDGTDPNRKWALTSPDGVVYYYDQDGFPTAVVDANGNTLTFTLEAVPNSEDPQGPAKRVVKVTDAAGQGASPAPNRSFDLTYYSKAEAKKPQVRGKVKEITDHNGTALDFAYYDDGNLKTLTERGGTTADGKPLGDRAFVFTYTTSDGSGPALDATQRANPPDNVGNESSRIYSVRDPRGHETTFDYLGPGNGTHRWRLKARTDREGNQTTYSYDDTARKTTVTEPLSRTTEYTWDTDGKVTAIKDAAGRTTNFEWTARRLTKVTEPTGRYWQLAYDGNGYVTDIWDAIGTPLLTTKRNHTTFDYDHPQAWLSQLSHRTDPKGNATSSPTDDYQWTFVHDAAGNIRQVIDPETDLPVIYDYNADGTIKTVTNRRGKVTTLDAYDANGFPTKITDPDNRLTTLHYDDDGLLQWVQDPAHKDDTGMPESDYRTEFFYDSWGRLGRESMPRSTHLDRGRLIWTGTDYDANDNVTGELAPSYGSASEDADHLTTHAYDKMDRPTLTTEPSATGTPVDSAYHYDAAGRLDQVTQPKGVGTASTLDYTTFYDYDALDRVLRTKQYELDDAGNVTRTLITHRCYDNAGDLVWITAPKAGLATVDCTLPTPPAYTTQLGYDEDHRLTSYQQPGKAASSQTYDANGNVDSTTDENGNTTTASYDQRDLMTQLAESLSATRKLFTEYRYDENGNVKEEYPPRAFDASDTTGANPDENAARIFEYDDADQLTKTTLPVDEQGHRSYIHRSYDDLGRPNVITLPVSSDTMATVADRDKTLVDYFDPGWVAWENPAGRNAPRVAYDYTAQGWQTLRQPDGARPDSDVASGDPSRGPQPRRWEYWPNGEVKTQTDADKNTVTYAYDADSNLHQIDDLSGAKTPGDVLTAVQEYDQLDRLVKVTQEKPNDNKVVTEQTYDADGNIETLKTNQQMSPDGAQQLQPPRIEGFSYDQADWLSDQYDYGTDTGSSDDRHVAMSFTPVGLPDTTTISRNVSGTWTPRQSTQWGYSANGLPLSLVTKNGAGDVKESHDISYLDTSGRYLDGNRTSDVFKLVGPDATSPCVTQTCTNSYEYDPRDRLTFEHRQRPTGAAEKTTHYILDAAGNVAEEDRDGEDPIFNHYDGLQLTRRTQGAAAVDFHYDKRGNMCAVTTDDGTDDDCYLSNDTARPSRLLSVSTWDGLDRLESVRSWDDSNSAPNHVDRTASYEYDAFNREISRTESHAGGSPRTTISTYIGATPDLAQEVAHAGDASGTRLWTRSYLYDTLGRRLEMEQAQPNAQTGQDDVKAFTYAYNEHGDVSLLLDSAGNAKASYGYLAYGQEDPSVSAELPFNGTALANATDRRVDPQNSFRYSGQRFDSGSGEMDMGARRYDSAPSLAEPGESLQQQLSRLTDVGRFVQQDYYASALDDLALGADEITGNRYALTGGDPINYTDPEGHGPNSSVTGIGPSLALPGTPQKTAAVVNRDATRVARRIDASWEYDQRVRPAFKEVGVSPPSYNSYMRNGGRLSQLQLSRLAAGATAEYENRDLEALDQAINAWNKLAGAVVEDMNALAFASEESAQTAGFGSIFGGLAKLARGAEVAEPAADSGIALARRLGTEGEAAAGIDAAAKVRIPSATGSAAYRIPDALSDTTLTEVKNVSRLGFTKQLQDFTYYAARTGRSFDLVVRQNTRLTGELERIIQVTGSPIRVVRALPSR